MNLKKVYLIVFLCSLFGVSRCKQRLNWPVKTKSLDLEYLSTLPEESIIKKTCLALPPHDPSLLNQDPRCKICSVLDRLLQAKFPSSKEEEVIYNSLIKDIGASYEEYLVKASLLDLKLTQQQLMAELKLTKVFIEEETKRRKESNGTDPKSQQQTSNQPTNTQSGPSSAVQPSQNNEQELSFTSILNYIFYENMYISVPVTVAATLITGFCYYKYKSNKAFEEDEDE